ncbi:hypothetical protein CYMTET_18167 [Cymbomonas tetramitiformis]|uniref:CRIM domain-containing protein n=1 Tax=Cymbomonas tetramitiformis TaxID=36881 RepID=A0AAE0L669_9CHLO|nr:hypothetical protein CYMTET_18167 [Cymbomonas tetramitiformis]
MEITEYEELNLVLGVFLKDHPEELPGLADSPPLGLLFTPDPSVSKAPTQFKKGTDKEKEKVDKDASANPPTTKQEWKKAEEPKQGWNTLFPKKDCPPPGSAPKKMVSALSQDIASQPPPKKPEKVDIVLKISILGRGTPWKITLSKKLSVETAIKTMLELHAKEGKEPNLGTDTSCYELRMMDGGAPDMTFGALDRKKPVGDFDDELALLQTKKPVAVATPEKAPSLTKSPESPKTPDSVSSDEHSSIGSKSGKDLLSKLKHSGGSMLSNDSYQQIISKGVSATVKTLTGQSSTSRVFLRVWIPGERTGHTVAMPSNATCEQLLAKVCKQRDLDSTGLALCRLGNMGHLPLNPNETISSINCTELQIVYSRSMKKVASTAFYFTEHTASQYKEYEVIKVNRHGYRQLRIMGIDREKIYNIVHPSEVKGESAPSHSSGIFSGILAAGNFLSKGIVTKKPWHLIRELRTVTILESEVDMFEVCYIGKSSAEDTIYQFAVTDPNVCAEIVARLHFLMQLLRSSSK